jgi:hypothetical protein
MLESFLLAVGGIGVMLAVGALEKWRRAQGRVRASLSEHPAWEAVADELVRALQPLEAEVEAYRDENEDVGVVVLVHGVDPGFVLRMSDGRTGDVEVGHLGFDQQFDVQGSTAMVRARLDGPTRDALLELARRPLRDGQLTVANGQLRAMVPPAQRAGLSDPAGAVPLLAKVARRLSARIDVIAELATNVREDPVAGVRVQCLRTLVRDSPRPASALAPLLGEAAHDPDPEVRLEAAAALGVEGEAVLGALVADTAVDDDIAARAAAILGPRIDAGVARATLQHERTVSSARRRPAVARACALALGERGEAQDEALLLAIAADDRDDALRLAAVRALARVGSAQAVPSLAELAGAASADLRRAGREAIATIQSRLHGATPGQLSLHAGGAGQVALADDAAGRLSRASATDER